MADQQFLASFGVDSEDQQQLLHEKEHRHEGGGFRHRRRSAGGPGEGRDHRGVTEAVKNSVLCIGS